MENEADVDVCDNEGWTPLHATASCGFTEIARYVTVQYLTKIKMRFCEPGIENWGILVFGMCATNFNVGIIQLFGHCIATWYAMSQSLVKLTEIGTSWGRG